jgi:hypothetical protein
MIFSHSSFASHCFAVFSHKNILYCAGLSEFCLGAEIPDRSVDSYCDRNDPIIMYMLKVKLASGDHISSLCAFSNLLLSPPRLCSVSIALLPPSFLLSCRPLRIHFLLCDPDFDSQLMSVSWPQLTRRVRGEVTYSACRTVTLPSTVS